MDVRICVVLLVVGGTYAFTGKGFFCRDPDSGKLHAVNTTWRSSTFCGNYTCKLKMKDLPSAGAIREFKVSNVNISDIQLLPIESLSQSEQNITNEEKRMSNILDTIISNINDAKNDEANKTAKVNETKKDNKNDRYLNDNEIKMISNLLHSVKRSDLEAVVDIYNLAQDIYKELDKKTSENLIQETVNEIQTTGRTSKMENQEPKKLTTSSPKVPHDKLSYWYDPLIIAQKARPILDLNTEGSEIIPSVFAEKKYNSPNSYSSHMLRPFQNYEKQPFFHALSDFQRQSSYVHTNPSYLSTPENSLTKQVTENSPILQTSTVASPAKLQTQPPILLPYPYYQVQYNTYNATGYPYHYFYGVNPYHDIYRKEYNKYYASPVPLYEPGNVSERSYKPGNLLGALLPKEDSNTKKPDWQTDSLSEDVIEDIRGHYDKNIIFKPLCLRKKIKLDKVGKVFKLEEGNRDKRSTSEDEPKDEKDDDRYEVYIERTTCQSDVDPGFFRMGNDTAPYPDCCPQRISR